MGICLRRSHAALCAAIHRSLNRSQAVPPAMRRPRRSRRCMGLGLGSNGPESFILSLGNPQYNKLRSLSSPSNEWAVHPDRPRPPSPAGPWSAGRGRPDGASSSSSSVLVGHLTLSSTPAGAGRKGAVLSQDRFHGINVSVCFPCSRISS